MIKCPLEVTSTNKIVISPRSINTNMPMKYIKFAYLLFAFLCVMLSQQSYAQQNIQFTQYIFNSLSVNPAYAGYKEEWFAQMGLRAQWVGVEGAPQTGSVSLDGILDPRDRKMGLGVQITADKLGAQSTNSATVNYAYRLQLDPEDNQRLSFGVAAGLAQYSLRGDLLHTIDGGDLALPTGTANSFVPDFRAGVFYNSNFVYAGLSVLDIFSGANDQPSTYSTLNIVRNRHIYLMAGGLINVSQQMRIRPSVLVKEDFRGPTSVDLNAMAIFNDRIWLGASYRTGLGLWKKPVSNLGKNNSVSAVVQFFVTERFRLGYSYDYVTSDLGSNQNGSHELTLGLAFGKVPRSLICPRVF
jgi:type IX secretion system PorP/SprF family membrane protein